MIDAEHDRANEQAGAELQEAPWIQAACGLCGAPLVEGCDDIYAELCATCERR